MDRKEAIIEGIKDRILAEHRKHSGIAWAEIAARKIYSQWIKKDTTIGYGEEFSPSDR